MSRAAAEHIVQTLRGRPEALLCLATGGSPALTYDLLAAQGRSEPGLFKCARLLKLDEWGGLPATHPATCEHYLQQRLVQPLGIAPERFFGWTCQTPDPALECARISDWLARQGPIDLNILGLGTNGHLGFNEPADSMTLEPHRAALSPASMGHAMLGAAKGTVDFGFTLGMGDIMHSREILLIVNGPHKAEPLRRMLCDGVTPRFPGSLLCLHPRLTVYCDAAAARLLEEVQP